MRTGPNQSIICCTPVPVKRTRLWWFLHNVFLLLQGLLVAVVLMPLHNFPKVCFTALELYHHSPDVGIASMNQSHVPYLIIGNLCYFNVTFRSLKSLVSRQMLFTFIHQSCLRSVFGSPFQIRYQDNRQTGHLQWEIHTLRTRRSGRAYASSSAIGEIWKIIKTN